MFNVILSSLGFWYEKKQITKHITQLVEHSCSSIASWWNTPTRLYAVLFCFWFVLYRRQTKNATRSQRNVYGPLKYGFQKKQQNENDNVFYLYNSKIECSIHWTKIRISMVSMHSCRSIECSYAHRWRTKVKMKAKSWLARNSLWNVRAIPFLIENKIFCIHSPNINNVPWNATLKNSSTNFHKQQLIRIVN